MSDDKIALIDLDGTVADYDMAMVEAQRALQSPGESPYAGRYTDEDEPPHFTARRRVILRQPGFWENLPRLQLGFHVVNAITDIGFSTHILTQGPRSTPEAWTEKLRWCDKYMPRVDVTITRNKSLVYGRVLVDDYAPYFTKWLEVRPRGLVVCVAHPWNEDFARLGSKAHPRVFRYDGTNLDQLIPRLQEAYHRPTGGA